MNSNQNYHEIDKNYLIKQNRKLRMELKQANQLKQLHKKALTDFSKAQNQASIIPILINIINVTSNESKLNQLNQQIMEFQGKIMVLEKIVNQTDENQKQTYNLLADQFQKLKQENAKKEDQLHKFYQKIGQVDYISGLVTKYKQLISTTQQAMAFKKEQDQLLDALNIQQQTIKKLGQQKHKLLKINIHMKQEVQKRKDQVRNMTMILMNEDMMAMQQEYQNGDVHDNFLDELGKQDNNENNNQNDQNDNQTNQPVSERNICSTPKSAKGSNMSFQNMSRINMSMSKAGINMSMMNANNQNNTINFVKMQRELIKEENQQKNSSDQSDLDCPQLTILFPDKVQKIVSGKQHAKIPYLNMKKIREMMTKRQEKMRKQWQQQKNHINPTQKIIQLQTQLEITRKQLANQSLKFRLMEEDIKRMSAQIQQIQKRNELLIQSNIKLKNNHQVIYKEYQISKSVTNEVQKILGMNITKDNEKIARQRLYQISIIKEKNFNQNISQINSKKQQQLNPNKEKQQKQIAINALNQIFVSKNPITTRKRVYSA